MNVNVTQDAREKPGKDEEWERWATDRPRGSASEQLQQWDRAGESRTEWLTATPASGSRDDGGHEDVSHAYVVPTATSDVESTTTQPVRAPHDVG